MNNYPIETMLVALGAFVVLLAAGFAHDSLFQAHM